MLFIQTQHQTNHRKLGNQCQRGQGPVGCSKLVNNARCNQTLVDENMRFLTLLG